MKDIKRILEDYKAGLLGEDEVLLFLKKAPFVEMDYAKIDTHRGLRQGTGEVIYGAGKTAGQIAGIVLTLIDNGQDNILVTRIDKEKSSLIAECRKWPKKYTYYEDAQIAVFGDNLPIDTEGCIVVITAGTSDIPVAEEAARTAEFLGNRVKRIYDAGVAGLHRLLAHIDDIMEAKVIIAIAGMEGALASVVGGLADCPVIAVPTSVGYGASFEGLSALLSMLNSCASGVSVVNIDNGFGAAYQASMINHM
ncbi:hypothetical protein SAMN04487934_10749 [Eubacterium ruminantium]|nr:hypothetical protein SAMN04487934_10749 [Eubacterium ruminantium]